jgi:hypothetical protein
MEGGREGGREGGKEGRREGREGEMEGGREEGGREGGTEFLNIQVLRQSFVIKFKRLKAWEEEAEAERE